MTHTEQQNASRLSDWYNFRQQLEKSNTPLEDVSNFFERFPRQRFYTDPYDQSTWPTAWELIDENAFCQFNVLLGICYTLQLTERFQNYQPKIKIAIDSESKNLYYLLVINNAVYGLLDKQWTTLDQLPKTLKIQKIYDMKPIH